MSDLDDFVGQRVADLEATAKRLSVALRKENRELRRQVRELKIVTSLRRMK